MKQIVEIEVPEFPKFTFDNVLALQCCMETVKKVQEDKELYEKLNLIHSKIYDAYRIEKQNEQASLQNNKNIDLTKILKDCPEGTKLYSPLFGEVYFNGIRSDDEYAITITEGDLTASSTEKGVYYPGKDGECLLFPSKEQKDWSKFSAPWYKKEELIKPKFKVGDIIRHKGADKDDDVYEISKVYNNSYGLFGSTRPLHMKYQDLYELVPNKFDPHTLKAFDKVLVRKDSEDDWHIDFFSCFKLKELPFCLSGLKCDVIPYNDDTKHLIGTTEEAPEYYRYWKN